MQSANKGVKALNIIRRYHPEVNSVVDGKRGLKIAVSQDDCRSAKKKAPDACAMARAFEREYDGAIISLSTAYLIKGDEAFRYRVPPSVARELVSFDRNKNFAPGEYRLSAPKKSHRLGARQGGRDKDNSNGRGHKKGPKGHKTTGIRAL